MEPVLSHQSSPAQADGNSENFVESGSAVSSRVHMGNTYATPTTTPLCPPPQRDNNLQNHAWSGSTASGQARQHNGNVYATFIGMSADWPMELRHSIGIDFEHLLGTRLCQMTGSSEDRYDAFLASLSFTEQHDREYNISTAMAQTFKWLFEETTASASLGSPTGFTNWLEKGDGIYWIACKAGSGKSTLMKYICEHPETNQHLCRWAGSSRLVVSKFYCWASGSSMQMSQEGMLRSILHDVARQAKDLIPAIAPQQWAATKTIGSQYYAPPWTLPALVQACNRLTLLNLHDFKIALFIDGLDQYHGDHDELLVFLGLLASRDRIKICASSRPWIIFEDAFKIKPSLKMQDLTMGDIKTYVDTELHRSSPFLLLEKASPSMSEDLITRIVEKASGVFFWVRLAVRELLIGLRRGDSIFELQQRVDGLPADLHEFFLNMLKSDDPLNLGQDLEEASRLFRMKLMEEGALHTLTLAFASTHGLYDIPHAPSWRAGPAQRDKYTMNDDAVLWLLESMDRRLNTATKGLLELAYHFEESDCGCNMPTKDVPLLESVVQYLHHTVKAFVEKPDTIELLQQSCYDAGLALCRGYASQASQAIFRCISTKDHEFHRNEDPWKYIGKEIEHASNSLPASRESVYLLLDGLSEMIYAYKAYNECCIPDGFSPPPEVLLELFSNSPRYAIPSFLPEALKLGERFDDWVRHILRRLEPGLLDSPDDHLRFIEALFYWVKGDIGLLRIIPVHARSLVARKMIRNTFLVPEIGKLNQKLLELDRRQGIASEEMTQRNLGLTWSPVFW